MITVRQCADYAGLAPSEMLLGTPPSNRHLSLLASYLLNLWRGEVAVRKIILADLRAFIDLGALEQAADLLLVLRIFLTRYPEARCAEHMDTQPAIVPMGLLEVDCRDVTAIRPECSGATLAVERAPLGLRQQSTAES